VKLPNAESAVTDIRGGKTFRREETAMTNEEIQRIIEFMIKRQEAFDARQERLQASHEKFEERHAKFEERHAKFEERQEQCELNHALLQTEVRGLAKIVGQIGEAQLRTQDEIFNLAKIVDGSVEIVTKERNGDGPQQ
jgi:uncharacterized coiled-coil DUF342 family protein